MVNDWETAVQLEAEEYAAAHIDEEKLKNKLFSDKAIRMRLIDEYKEACAMKELNGHIANAVAIIQRDGRQDLDIESWEALEQEMVQAAGRVASIDFDPETMTFQEYLGMTDRAFGYIEALATKKYENKELAECVSLYAFLSAMKGTSPTYWCRLGIALQECEDVEKAVHAFDTALEFDPANIGAWLFSSECYLDLDNQNEAAKRVEEARRLIEEQHVENQQTEDKWLELLNVLQNKINK